MSEKRLLNSIFAEGLLLITLSLCTLILPKLTSLTFGVMLSATFIIYGLYKVLSSFLNKYYISNIFWSIFLGLFILTIGILLLIVPKISLLWLIALIGVFFILESISSVSFMSKMRSIFNYLSYKGLAALVLFLAVIIIILGLPLMSFWMVVIISALALLIKGMAKLTISLSNRNNYNL